jgi:hypothetical protein
LDDTLGLIKPYLNFHLVKTTVLTAGAKDFARIVRVLAFVVGLAQFIEQVDLAGNWLVTPPAEEIDGQHAAIGATPPTTAEEVGNAFEEVHGWVIG